MEEGGSGWREGGKCDQNEVGLEVVIRRLRRCRHRSQAHRPGRQRQRRARRRNALEVVGWAGEHSEQAW